MVFCVEILLLKQKVKISVVGTCTVGLIFYFELKQHSSPDRGLQVQTILQSYVATCTHFLKL